MHLIIILDKHAQCAIASFTNASNTVLADRSETLRTKAIALDAYIPNMTSKDDQYEAHELLHDIQNMFVDICDNQNLTGYSASNMDTFIDACNDFLP